MQCRQVGVHAAVARYLRFGAAVVSAPAPAPAQGAGAGSGRSPTADLSGCDSRGAVQGARTAGPAEGKAGQSLQDGTAAGLAAEAAALAAAERAVDTRAMPEMADRIAGGAASARAGAMQLFAAAPGVRCCLALCSVVGSWCPENSRETYKALLSWQACLMHIEGLVVEKCVQFF